MEIPRPKLDRASERVWCARKVRWLLDDAARAVDTPIWDLRLPGYPRVRLLLKDETAHPSGSLKHRLARSLFLDALCGGRLRPGQAAVDASSGSTAISEAWFARHLGVPFTAVMPRDTALEKQRAIAALGGRCALIEPGTDVALQAEHLAGQMSACYLDQFRLAASATDWRANNNIAQSILRQCAGAGDPDPAWIVCGAGTGGTSNTIGRYLRYRGVGTRLCIAEPAGAAFAVGWRTRDRQARAVAKTFVEGIGRPRVEPCFTFELADEVREIPDAASIAGMWLLLRWTKRRYGGSSGTNLMAALQLAHEMHRRDEAGTIVSLLCDEGERYDDTLWSERWCHAMDLDPDPWFQAVLNNSENRASAPPRAIPGD